jgi:hypothetical protein
MAGVADESSGRRRQQCVDVLCGYLRLPYLPEFGSNGQTQLILTEPHTGDDGSSLGQRDLHFEYRQNDKEVRATIVRLIGDHLRDYEESRSACDFDFGGAYLDDVNFSNATFAGRCRFSKATFSGGAKFLSAKFSHETLFFEATFESEADFAEAKFFEPVGFRGAEFCGFAIFENAEFLSNAHFGDDETFGAYSADNRSVMKASNPTR